MHFHLSVVYVYRSGVNNLDNRIQIDGGLIARVSSPLRQSRGATFAAFIKGYVGMHATLTSKVRYKTKDSSVWCAEDT